MKKVLLLFLITIIMLTCIVCIDTDITIEVNDKGDADIITDIIVDDNVFEEISEKDLYKIRNKHGSIEKITSIGKSGYRVKEDLGKITTVEDNKSLSKISGADEFKSMIDIKTENSLFYNIYNINFKIKDYTLKMKSNSDKSSEE